MDVNVNLSVKGCWRMVNAVSGGKSKEEILERCKIAEEWLRENVVISNLEYNDLMMALSYQRREAYRM